MAVDITRDRSKTLKKDETKNEKNSNNSFSSFNFLYRKTYILLENIFEETQFTLLHSQCSFLTWQVIGNAVTPTPI